jgi:hypothetical protein
MGTVIQPVILSTAKDLFTDEQLVVNTASNVRGSFAVLRMTE